MLSQGLRQRGSGKFPLGGRRGEVLFVDMELHYDLFYTVSHILK